MNTLRFIVDQPQSAAFNMAADQYLLGHCENSDTIFVRFYQWQHPSITLGYMQKASETLLIDKIHNDKAEWIRRPTGGRAVLHKGDLTYSCIFPKTVAFMGSSVKESYAVITQCLRKGLEKTHILSSTHDSYDDLLAVKREVKLPCFLAPNRDEIMVNGRKLVGSAQKRTTSGILQHGSIPITPEFADLPEYLLISPEEQKKQKHLLLSKCMWSQEIQPDLKPESLVHSLIDGFIETFKIPGETRPWNETEILSIQALASSPAFIETWMK